LIPDPVPNTSFDKPERGLAIPPEPPKPAPERTGKKIGTSKTEVFSQEVAERIRLREIETRALADRAVIAEWDRSVAAKTFPEKREALKQYYTLLYARMVKLDPALKVQIDKRADVALKRLVQRFESADTLDDRDRNNSARVFAD
jgi:hypothetical protein